MVGSLFAIAILAFLVWAHHMFTSGMNEYLRLPFMYSTLLVAIPTGVKFFSWVATIWKGKLTYPAAMLFVLGGIISFLLGGLTGPPNATYPLECKAAMEINLKHLRGLREYLTMYGQSLGVVVSLAPHMTLSLAPGMQVVNLPVYCLERLNETMGVGSGGSPTSETI